LSSFFSKRQDWNRFVWLRSRAIPDSRDICEPEHEIKRSFGFFSTNCCVARAQFGFYTHAKFHHSLRAIPVFGNLFLFLVVFSGIASVIKLIHNGIKLPKPRAGEYDFRVFLPLLTWRIPWSRDEYDEYCSKNK